MADNSGVRATRLLAVFSTLVVGAGHLIGAAETVVDAKEGNIVLRMGVDGQKKLTNSGRDSKPVVSPDGKWVVFVRSLVGKQIATGSGNYGAEELWQIGIDGKDLIRLVAPKDAENVSDVIATFDAKRQIANGFADAAERAQRKAGNRAWWHRFVDDNVRALAVLAENFNPGGTDDGEPVLVPPFLLLLGLQALRLEL